MDVRLLGTLEVANGHRSIDFWRPQHRTLVAALAVRANAVVSSDRLVEDLWEDQAPHRADASLRALVSHVRRALAEAGCGAVLASRRPGYLLELGEDELDVWRFERLAATGHQQLADGDASAAAGSLRDALAIWRGPALADFAYCSFAEAEARRLEEARLAATEDLVDARLEVGDHQALIGDLAQLVGAHPLRERFTGQLMLALYRAGRQAEALRVYSRLRTTLADELGIPPCPALQELEAKVLRQDGSIRWRITGVVAEDPARSPAPVPRRGVPTPISSFVGRVDEQATVAAMLAEARLVTLTGPGGCGKTRLAYEVAARHEAPAVVVELGPLADAHLLAATVADALGVREDPSRPLTDSVPSAIGSEHLLLVLDNCEQLALDVARMAADLLHRCPALRLLATSRRSLGITGERVWPLPPLRLPGGGRGDGSDPWWSCEAVDLFAQRAAAVRPGFEITDGNAPVVVSLCQRLDGLPLAIELAAARMAVLSLEEIDARLADPFTVLAATSRVAPARQQTLRATVEWSYRLLAPDDRALFARLSVFRGGFTLAAAEAVAAGGTPGAPSVLDGVTALVETSLVSRLAHDVAPARFGLLQTLGAYGAERLAEAGEGDTTAEQHVTWCVAMAEASSSEIRGPEQHEALRRLDLEEDNLRAALDRVLARGDVQPAVALTSALWWYWFRRGRVREGRDRLARLLAFPMLGDQPRRDALAAAAHLAWIASEPDEADMLSREAAALAAHDAALGPSALALDVAGLVACSAGDLERAEALFEQALDVWRVRGDAWGEAWVLRHRSVVRYRQGLVVEAAALAGESRDRFLQVGDEWGVAGSVDALASITRRQGALAEARRLGSESIERHRRLGEPAGLAIALHHQAELLLDLDDLDGAAELAAESVALDRQNGVDEDHAAATLLARIDLTRRDAPSSRAQALDPSRG